MKKTTYHQETNIHVSFMNRCRKSVVLLRSHFNELKWQYIPVPQSQYPTKHPSGNTLTKTIGLIGLLCCNANALADQAPQNADPQPTSHIIQKGENLHMLSERYKVSVADLQKFNGIEDVNKVSVGQTIFLVQITGLVQQAQVALTRKKYNVAIKLLLELKQQGNVEERQFALEFLGVAREKKGQKAWAKQAYQAFISEHPDSKHFSRVKMRLDNLIGIQTLAKNRTLSKGKGKSKSKTRAKRDYTRGSVSMDYRKGKLTNNDGISRDTLSLLNTDLNAKGYYGFDDYSLGFRI
ncbi:MAG: LysM peptidoglycan-binding domain-containing protein, partial [Psychrosphaera sp.]|nr:LysM peptidoglycan-binding domain-containing protein [Psychrosphaera sp.]